VEPILVCEIGISYLLVVLVNTVMKLAFSKCWQFLTSQVTVRCSKIVLHGVRWFMLMSS